MNPELLKAINQLISGMMMMGYLVGATFFFRFWRDTRDRLFALFGLSFLILAVQRLGFGLTSERQEDATFWYVIRLVAFLIILVAIVDKNRGKR